MKKLLFVFLFMFCFSAVSIAAEGVTWSFARDSNQAPTWELRIAYETSGSDGTLSVNTRVAPTSYYGRITRVVHVPGGTAVTDDTADITLLDEDGADLFGGELENISSGEVNTYTPKSGGAYVWVPIQTKPTLEIANNSVNSGAGTIILYIDSTLP